MKLKVHPQPGYVYVKLDEVKVGGLVTDSKESAIEAGTVISVGEGVSSLKKGDTVFAKSWAFDIIDYKGERYCFINMDTKGVLAVYEDR